VRLEAVEEHCEVWEDNWDIVMMFLRMQTQWNVSMAGLTGLNYSSVEYLGRLYPVKDPVALFEGLQVMEIKALTCLNKKNS
jgi:hypothetical protein